ncbi:MAG: putative nucleotidyltransferase with HDIG domain [Candidatus Nanohaloarchaea archaeon]|jgi:putative nucleotidyltransferase with HDIG domain
MLEDKEREELKNRLKKEFSDYYEIAGGKNYRFTHLKTVRKIALKLAERISGEPDTEILEVAALYHDIGRAEDIEGGEMDPFEGHEGHEERGAKEVSEFVKDFVSERQLEKVEKIIGNHHSKPETLEGKIVQDADAISNFGVNNLWRQIHYASYYERNLEDSIDYFWNTAVDEYQEKIESMHFQVSKEIAEKRLKRQKKAIKDIEREMEAEDI